MRVALQFLTIIPVPAPLEPPGAAAAWYPAVGALIGLIAAAAWHTPMQATLAIAAAIVITGGLHEDGLADVADAIRAGRSRQRMFEILKDSRVGAYGAIALVLSILIRWQAMAKLTGNVWWKFALAFAVARAAMVLIAATTPSAAPGLGEAFVASIPKYAPILVAAQCAALAYPVGARGWIALVAVAAAVMLARAWFLRRLGGITGDCLGFTCQAAEATALVALAW